MSRKLIAYITIVMLAACSASTSSNLAGLAGLHEVVDAGETVKGDASCPTSWQDTLAAPKAETDPEDTGILCPLPNINVCINGRYYICNDGVVIRTYDNCVSTFVLDDAGDNYSPDVVGCNVYSCGGACCGNTCINGSNDCSSCDAGNVFCAYNTEYLHSNGYCSSSCL